MNSSVVELSSENVVNGIVGETTPSTSEYGFSMKVGIVNFVRKLIPTLLFVQLSILLLSWGKAYRRASLI